MRRFTRFAHIFTLLFLLIFVHACEEPKPDDIYKQLEVKAKITTFPLTVVVTDRLTGDEFPDDLKKLCGYSESSCRTLPVAGLLRLGPDQYYTYNTISTISVSSSEGDDDKSLASSVRQQVGTYQLKTSLKKYDSLRSPNHEAYNIRLLTADYIRTTEDSIFFFSAMPSSPSFISIGQRNFRVYTDAGELRRMVDDLVCRGQATISIIYSPGPLPQISAGAGLNSGNEGIYAGDTCIGGSRFERRNDGKGNYFVGRLVEENSKSCGFTFPTGVAGDTCIGKARYQRLHNGRGGFTLGQLIEKNSTSCGFTYPTGLAGDTCVNGSKYQKMHNGSGGFVLGNLLEKNSRACGVAFPAKGTVASGFLCYEGSKYEKAHDGAGGFTRGRLLQANSNECIATKPATKPVVTAPVPAKTVPAKPAPATTTSQTRSGTSANRPAEQAEAADKRCARQSDPVCEQDAQGNYTGRRVQYCYNSNNKIVRTIVLAKCDGDCRCLGD